MADIHLMGGQDEGINSKDPVRYGRIAAWGQVVTIGQNMELLRLSYHIYSWID